MNLVRNLQRISSNLAKNIWLDFTTPKTRKFKFMKAWAGTNYGFITQFSKLPDVDFIKVYPEASTLIIPMEVQVTFLDNSLTQLYYLSCLGKLRHFHRIFEIGTATGVTSLQLARICEDAQVFTINLPQEADNRFIVGK